MSLAIFPILNIGDGSLSAMAKPDASLGLRSQLQEIAASGITEITSLLTQADSERAMLDDEEAIAKSFNMGFNHFPIEDFGIPSSLSDFASFIDSQYQSIQNGSHTVIHCYAGIGRTGMVTASLLMKHGYEPQEAFSHVSLHRGAKVPDTDAQYDWVVRNYQAIKGASM